jgi:gamma-glutamylcyclotransferase (GGCT)/AIG2-like uncharacterized protein YtfP
MRSDNDAMKVGENIFVYGTLKKGFGANPKMDGGSDFIQDDRISATMYSLGGFPGIKVVGEASKTGEPVPFVSEGPTVTGELYRITDEDLPHSLDRYEGYPFLYGRRRVVTASGNVTWVYEWNGEYSDPAEKSERLVPTGTW